MPKILTVPEMIAIEKAADAAGHSYADMMQSAGRSVANAIIAHSHKSDENILALIGKGNNGGDALIALEKLSKAGFNTTAILLAENVDLLLIKALKSASGTIVDFEDLSNDDLKDLIIASDIFIDALLGTGIKLPLRKSASSALKKIGDFLLNLKERPIVLAVDCPSGMDADSGELAPETIPADITLTMAAVKKGILTFPAYEYLGELLVGDIGLPADMLEWQALDQFIVDHEIVSASLLERPLNAHKSLFGKTLIIAGSEDYPGAALLSAKAAARSGAGLVSLSEHANLKQSFAGHLPEATWLSLAKSKESRSSQWQLSDYSSLLIGPGLTPATWNELNIDQILSMKSLPNLVLDAEALRVLARRKSGPASLSNSAILTPHPGEFSALTGLPSIKIQANRLDLAKKYAQQWGHVVVLKGALTVIAEPGGKLAVIPVANPALATAGSGDVLAGLIAGLWAQGMPPFESAFVGAWAHAQASLLASDYYSSNRGILASDLIEFFPELLAK